MTSIFRIGQCLSGKVGAYTIHKQVQDFIWLASNKLGQNVLVKSAHHPRIANERNVSKLFQARTASLRPLVDEIKESGGPTTIVLKHLDDDLHDASAAKRLTSSEIKYVSKKILEGLKVIHEGGYVHTDVKLDNVLVSYGPEESGPRFTDVQLADLENTVHVESRFRKDRDAIGAPLWRSPEAQLGLQWGPAADIWAFGSMVISLIWGDNFFIFKPDVPRGHDEYEFKILEKYHIYFGPYPPTIICRPR